MSKKTHLRSFDQSLPMALLKAREAVMSQFRPILRDHDITEQQWRVIRALNGTQGLEATELAEKTVLLMPSLTRIVKALEEKKWIERSVVDGDNRRRQIRISPKGRALYEKIAPLSEQEYAKLENRIGDAKLRKLYQLLDDVCD